MQTYTLHLKNMQPGGGMLPLNPLPVQYHQIRQEVKADIKDKFDSAEKKLRSKEVRLRN